MDLHLGLDRYGRFKNERHQGLEFKILTAGGRFSGYCSDKHIMGGWFDTREAAITDIHAKIDAWVKATTPTPPKPSK